MIQIFVGVFWRVRAKYETLHCCSSSLVTSPLAALLPSFASPHARPIITQVQWASENRDSRSFQDVYFCALLAMRRARGGRRRMHSTSVGDAHKKLVRAPLATIESWRRELIQLLLALFSEDV